MAQVYMTDGRIVEVLPENGKAFSLGELKEIVGGYIKFQILRDGSIACMNEDGKLIPLPINLIATHYFAIPGDIIHGNMIVMSMKEAGE